MRKRIVRGRLSYGMADRTLRHMTGEPIVTHISKVTASAIAKCIALQSVKGLRLRQMR
jgi:hypothetical protein